MPADRNAHEEIEAAPAIPSEPISETRDLEPAAVDAAAPVTKTDATDVVQEPVAATQAIVSDDSIVDVEAASLIATETSPEPKAQKVPKRARVSTPLAPQIPVEVPAAPPKSFLEEMTDLEIATLRRQLAAMLAQQNAHMRLLLDRYEAAGRKGPAPPFGGAG